MERIAGSRMSKEAFIGMAAASTPIALSGLGHIPTIMRVSPVDFILMSFAAVDCVFNHKAMGPGSHIQGFMTSF